MLPDLVSVDCAHVAHKHKIYPRIFKYGLPYQVFVNGLYRQIAYISRFYRLTTG